MEQNLHFETTTMVELEPLQIYCTSNRAHEQLLTKYSSDLLRLSEKQKIRVYSPSEIENQNNDVLGEEHISNEEQEMKNTDLNISKVVEDLTTSWLGHNLIYAKSTSSTQNILQQTFQRFGHGWVVISGFQTNGRGRRGTSWSSPEGSVALSIGLQIEASHAQRLTFVQYIAALAVTEICKHKEWSDLKITLKWPNDIYLEGSKVGGILCECVMRDNIFHLVVGVGMNICNERPTTCLCRDGGRYVREKFLAHYLSAFQLLYDEFCERGFTKSLENRYIEKWMHSGQIVRLGGSNGPKATVVGLASNGWVRVFRDDWQAFQDLPPEDTSLDLANNVIKKKN